MNHDYLQLVQANPLDVRECWRVDPAQFGTELLDSPFANLLTNKATVRRDSEEHMAAPLIEHRAHSFCGLASGSSGGLTLNRL